MNEHTKAQRLAEILQYKIPSMECLEEAAAELRRLDALNAELVEALKAIEAMPEDSRIHYKVARRALAKVQENEK